MQFFSSALLVLVALSGYASALNQIKCYSCTSETDPNCNDPLNTEHGLVAKECTNDLTNNILGGLNTGLKGIGSIFGLEKTPQIDATFVCIKGAYTSKSQDGSEKKMVVRSCGVAGSKICESLNQKSKEGGISDVFCEECNTDGCNGSSAIHAAAFLLIPALALLLRSH